MQFEDRKQLILSLVDSKDHVNIDSLIEACGVSKATIYRDVKILENAGWLKRSQGTLFSVKRSLTAEPLRILRSDSNIDEKKRIANAALDYIQNGHTVLLDCGTTVFELAKLLDRYYNLMVATFDIVTSYELATMPNIDLIITGGLVRHNHYSMIGAFAEQVINQLHADSYMMSADALDLNHGCMCYSMEEMQIKRAMKKAARTTILLCDHSKFDTIAFVNVCALQDIDVIITGNEIDKMYLDRLQELEIEVICV